MTDFISMLIPSILQLTIFSLIPFIFWCFSKREQDFFTWIGLKWPVFEGSVCKVSSIIIIVVVLYIGAMMIIMTTLLSDVTTATSQFAGKD